MDREAIAKGREIGEGDVLSWFERNRALQEERRARRVAIAMEWLVLVVGAWRDLGAVHNEVSRSVLGELPGWNKFWWRIWGLSVAGAR